MTASPRSRSLSPTHVSREFMAEQLVPISREDCRVFAQPFSVTKARCSTQTVSVIVTSYRGMYCIQSTS